MKDTFVCDYYVVRPLRSFDRLTIVFNESLSLSEVVEVFTNDVFVLIHKDMFWCLVLLLSLLLEVIL